MEEDTADTLIGLDVRGQVFYCNKSKLLNVNNGCSYFSARFREDSMLDASLDRVDDKGRDIYKLDVDPIIFQYIIEYINTDKKPIGIGVYEKNKKLWSLVREEAIYFGLDSLIELLKITFSCSPEVDGNKGIMYWLGTKKGTSDYDNPYSRDVTISGSLFEVEEFGPGYAHELAIMVQYRPIPESDKLFDADISYADCDRIFAAFNSIDGEMMGCDCSFQTLLATHLIFIYVTGWLFYQLTIRSEEVHAMAWLVIGI